MMMKRRMIALVGLGLVLATGCRKNTEEGSSPPPDTTQDTTDRPSLTNAECEGMGGTVVGDIGDGAIHRPDYRCEGGQPPLGNIRAAEGEPMAIEGAVCCPAP